MKSFSMYHEEGCTYLPASTEVPNTSSIRYGHLGDQIDWYSSHFRDVKEKWLLYICEELSSRTRSPLEHNVAQYVFLKFAGTGQQNKIRGLIRSWTDHWQWQHGLPFYSQFNAKWRFGQQSRPEIRPSWNVSYFGKFQTYPDISSKVNPGRCLVRTWGRSGRCEIHLRVFDLRIFSQAFVHHPMASLFLGAV